jgi:hypothetical protein
MVRVGQSVKRQKEKRQETTSKKHKQNKLEERVRLQKELAEKQKAVESLCASYCARRNLFYRYSTRTTKPTPPDTPTRCPECEYKMSREEIDAGFLDDPYDFTTCCPDCNYRFTTMTIYPVTKTQQDIVVRLCKEQTIEALYNWSLRCNLIANKDQFLEWITLEPVLVWNILRHGEEEHGSNIQKIANDWFPEWELDENPEKDEDDSSSSSALSWSE